MAKIKLHFAHANGFPAGSYQRLFSHLEPDFEVMAIEKFAHNHQFPVSRDWQMQVEELKTFLLNQTDQPVFAVGHSFGAVISYMLACQHPKLVKGLIMLDPPLVTGLTAAVARLARATVLFDKFTPAQKAATRCISWPLETDMVDYFAQKALFKDMHIECIQDYVSAVINKDKAAFRLNFDHQVEADLFRTVPLNLSRYYGKLSVPAVLITGGNTQVCRPHLIRPFIKHNKLAHQVVDGGGHMFPLELPDQVAARINRQIRAWTSNDG